MAPLQDEARFTREVKELKALIGLLLLFCFVCVCVFFFFFFFASPEPV